MNKFFIEKQGCVSVNSSPRGQVKKISLESDSFEQYYNYPEVSKRQNFSKSALLSPLSVKHEMQNQRKIIDNQARNEEILAQKDKEEET